MTQYNEFSDDEKQAFKDFLNGHLRYGPVNVKFTKKDGTVREMNCTLKEDLVKPHVKKTDREKIKNPEVCSVFDCEKQEWRSFRYETVIEIGFTIGENTATAG